MIRSVPRLLYKTYLHARSKPRSWTQRGHLERQTVLLTATIEPPAGAPRLARRDPDVRRRDYRQALSWYLGVESKWIQRVVFADNSNSDVSDFEALARSEAGDKDVEIMSFNGLDYPEDYHRGYGEFKLIDTVLSTSRILGSLGSSDVFWKATGRYRILNIAQLFDTAPPEFHLYADLHPSKQYMDLRVFAATINGYDLYLRGKYLQLARVRPEDYLYRELIKHAEEHAFVGALNRVPVVAGVAAVSNRPYRTGRERLSHCGRVALGRLFPRLWY